MIAPTCISPIQGFVLWLCPHSSEGRYRLVMRLRPYRAIGGSPEGAVYINNGYGTLGKPSSITSPEGVEYDNEAITPPTAQSPEGAVYINDGKLKKHW